MTASPIRPDLLAAMAQHAAEAVAAAAGSSFTAGPPSPVPLDSAPVGPVMALRAELSSGPNAGGLVTVVPASGLVGGGTAIDPTRLAAALTEGAVAGIADAGGPVLTPTPVQPLVSTPGAEAVGAAAYELDLLTGNASIKVRWVVEATLGSLLGGAIPVDAPATEGPSVAPATLPELNRASVSGAGRDIQVLSDVATTVSVEIAKGVLQVKDLVELTSGQVIELDREAGDPVDVLVNGSLVAKGDIVVVGNQIGVRLVQIVEPA